MSHTPDHITVTNDGNASNFKPHPEGQFAAYCADVVNLGERLKTWGANPKIVPTAGLVFITGERHDTGALIEINTEFTVSMFEQAKLRLFLESWRGKPYTEDEARAGVPLHKLVGVPALISVAHEVSKKGRTYATITAIMPLPKSMPRPDVSVGEYERAPYWATRKEGYALEVTNFRKANQMVGDVDVLETPADDLPF